LDTLRKLPKRQRRVFKSQADAEAYGAQLQEQLENYGRRRVLSPLQQSDALLGFAALEDAGLRGVSLHEAARFYAKHHGVSNKLVATVFNEFLLEKREETHLRPYYLKTLQNPLRATLATFGDRVMADVMEDELNGFFRNLKKLDGTPMAPYSKHAVYRYSRMLWTWAKMKKHITLNPFVDLKAPWLPALTPRILTISEVERLLETASRPEHEAWLPYVVLGLFCGVRTTELQRLTWSAIRDDWTLSITAAVAKKRRARNVPIPLNAQLMLNPFMDRTGPKGIGVNDPILNIQRVALPRHDARTDGKVNLWKNWRKLIHDAGLDPWDKNSMRHSYASYLYCITGEDSRLTIDRMGHSDVQVLFDHYVQHTPDRVVALGYWMASNDKAVTQAVREKISGFISMEKMQWQDILQTLNIARF
jgi:integrase